ncbi:MAG TPA: glycoside hydrolase family 5 protein [Paludibacter sp.]|nr:glycoside hydrolase family 5 protein [Paludibacter sp.]
MKKHIFLFIFTVFSPILFASCKDREPETIPAVTTTVFRATPDILKYAGAGGNDTLAVTMNGNSWAVSSDQTWCTVSFFTSSKASDKLIVTAAANTTAVARTANLTLIMDKKTVIHVNISQAAKAGLYPSYKDSIAPDATGMSSTATELAKKIKVGLNIGNTLEASGGETGWGNPLITNDLIKAVKQNGFNAIRLPCDWNQYADQTTAKISATWLSRVKQVVQYCVDNDMYVIVNIHWDGGWLENNCTEAKKVENNAKQKAFWEQIATSLRGFDEHVLFASANEPNVADATQMAVLLSYHQTFINAVRSTGGKNAYRVLVVQGPSTDIEKTNTLMTQLPTDKLANRMMAEVHYYTPWNFCGMTKDETWGNQFYYWGANYHSTTDTAHNPTWGEEATVDANFALMKKQFGDKGIPVVIGEFGAITRTNLTGDALKLHLASRAFYFKYVTKQAIANGFLPFFWDTGGLINRNSYTVSDQQALDGLIQGATE